MTQALAHRGPDDEGRWADDRVALGVRRLSIIDLAGGHQPIVSPTGAVIAFNGEIYNYRQLREQLADQGYRFRTSSDTEVVLALYVTHGISAIERLAGMFAFCIYDPSEQRVHLVRDRLGVKPLYYHQSGSQLVFASEIKAILAAMERRPAIDRQALHDYLSLRYTPGPTTIWAGIQKLPPAHRLTFDVTSASAAQDRYWSAPFLSEDMDPQRDYPAEFEALLTAAVRKRLEAADVPVGVLLSGGLDSGALSAAAVEAGHRSFHTFSIGFEGDEVVDELPYARQVAAAIGSEHHEVRLGRTEFLDLLPQLVESTDEPLADLAAVPLFVVSRLAREHVKVALSGEGSDEVLAGYDLERLARRLDQMRQLARLRRPLLRAGSALLPSRRADYLRLLAREDWSGFARAQALHMTSVWPESEKAALWGESSTFRPTATLIRDWYRDCPSPHPLDQVQQVYCGSWLVEDLLMKADKMSMATSLEVRVPFLDHELVEWATRLPVSWKVGDRRGGYVSKRILREFAASRLPASIVQRPKQGFPVPAYRWLAGELGGWAEELVAGTSGPLLEFFAPGPLRSEVMRARGGDLEAAHRTWAVIVLHYWMERWL